MKINDFKEDLAFSHAQADRPWWEEVYTEAFPRFKCLVDVREDGPFQRGGVDRIVHIDGGKMFAVDEKVRRKDWPDILLEVWSDKDRQTRGWICKPLICDYIAYAFAPSGRCYLLPVPQLQRAWRQNHQRWWKEKQHIYGGNRGWVTESVAVETQELLDAVRDAFFVQGQPGAATPTEDD